MLLVKVCKSEQLSNVAVRTLSEIYMPSAKPDKNEMKLLRKKRNLYYNQHQNLFSKIFIESSSAIKGDSINKAKVEKLFQFIDSDDTLKNIFPNNILHELLHSILLKKEVDNTSKEIMLNFLSVLYTNNHCCPIKIRK